MYNLCRLQLFNLFSCSSVHKYKFIFLHFTMLDLFKNIYFLQPLKREETSFQILMEVGSCALCVDIF